MHASPSFLEDLFFGHQPASPTTTPSLLAPSTTASPPMDRKQHSCTACGYQTCRKGDLVKHMRIHNGIRPYQCPQCGRAFTQSSHLRVHMGRTHSQS